MGLSKNIAIGETISVLLEKIEDKNGDVVVSASKAQRLKDGINWLKHMKRTNHGKNYIEMQGGFCGTFRYRILNVFTWFTN